MRGPLEVELDQTRAVPRWVTRPQSLARRFVAVYRVHNIYKPIIRFGFKGDSRDPHHHLTSCRWYRSQRLAAFEKRPEGESFCGRTAPHALISLILTDRHVLLKRSNQILAWLRYHDSVLAAHSFAKGVLIDHVDPVDAEGKFLLFG